MTLDEFCATFDPREVACIVAADEPTAERVRRVLPEMQVHVSPFLPPGYFAAFRAEELSEVSWMFREGP